MQNSTGGGEKESKSENRERKGQGGSGGRGTDVGCGQLSTRLFKTSPADLTQTGRWTSCHPAGHTSTHILGEKKPRPTYVSGLV